MADTTIIKVDAAHSPKGAGGQKYLANGRTVSMRLWEREAPGPATPPSRPCAATTRRWATPSPAASNPPSRVRRCCCTPTPPGSCSRRRAQLPHPGGVHRRRGHLAARRSPRARRRRPRPVPGGPSVAATRDAAGATGCGKRPSRPARRPTGPRRSARRPRAERALGLAEGEPGGAGIRAVRGQVEQAGVAPPGVAHARDMHSRGCARDHGCRRTAGRAPGGAADMLASSRPHTHARATEPPARSSTTPRRRRSASGHNRMVARGSPRTPGALLHWLPLRPHSCRSLERLGQSHRRPAGQCPRFSRLGRPVLPKPTEDGCAPALRRAGLNGPSTPLRHHAGGRPRSGWPRPRPRGREPAELERSRCLPTNRCPCSSWTTTGPC